MAIDDTIKGLCASALAVGTAALGIFGGYSVFQDRMEEKYGYSFFSTSGDSYEKNKVIDDDLFGKIAVEIGGQIFYGDERTVSLFGEVVTLEQEKHPWTATGARLRRDFLKVSDQDSIGRRVLNYNDVGSLQGFYQGQHTNSPISTKCHKFDGLRPEVRFGDC